MEEKLAAMEENMKSGDGEQWQLYIYIVEAMRSCTYLRLLVQASAGTGKSYVLKALCLWCLLKRKAYKAAAPTGIAAANLELPGTDAAATTIHNLFELDAELKTKMGELMEG